MHCRRKNKVHTVSLKDKNLSSKIRNELGRKQTRGVFSILFPFLVKAVVSGMVSGLANKSWTESI